MEFNFNDFDFSDLDLSNIDISDIDIDLTLKKLDSLIAEIEKDKTPVIRKTPEAIENNADPIERENELVEFTHLHNLYIKPLSELAKMICNKKGLSYSEIPCFSNLSIIGRISHLCDFLIEKGCTIDTIKQFLPSLPNEVEELLDEKKKLTTLIIRKTPDVIQKNSNHMEREKELAEFSWLHELYVEPLVEFSKRVCTRLELPYSEIPNLSKFSIMGRMSKLCNFLIEKGCTMDIIKQILPSEESEIKLLASANKQGFDMGFNGINDLTNKNRVERAKNHLLNNAIKNLNKNEKSR